ncbi:MAG: hypothetical protein HYY04_05045 [Chloroflexi bacterium]|nr:hypothetical protein [Chloroflexota bacterium]
MRVAFAAPLAVALPPQITNVTDLSFAVAWVTDQPAIGELRYGTDPARLDNTLREAAEGHVHHIVVQTALAGTRFYVDVVSGGQVDDRGGAHYQPATGPTISPSMPRTISGQVRPAAGGELGGRALVLVRVKNADGQGSSGSSTWLSTVTEGAGDWTMDLAPRTVDLSGYFDYGIGDKLEIEVYGGPLGFSPRAEIVLSTLGSDVGNLIDREIETTLSGATTPPPTVPPTSTWTSTPTASATVQPSVPTPTPSPPGGAATATRTPTPLPPGAATATRTMVPSDGEPGETPAPVPPGGSPSATPTSVPPVAPTATPTVVGAMSPRPTVSGARSPLPTRPGAPSPRPPAPSTPSGSSAAPTQPPAPTATPPGPFPTIAASPAAPGERPSGQPTVAPAKPAAPSSGGPPPAAIGRPVGSPVASSPNVAAGRPTPGSAATVAPTGTPPTGGGPEDTSANGSPPFSLFEIALGLVALGAGLLAAGLVASRRP